MTTLFAREEVIARLPLRAHRGTVVTSLSPSIPLLAELTLTYALMLGETSMRCVIGFKARSVEGSSGVGALGTPGGLIRGTAAASRDHAPEDIAAPVFPCGLHAALEHFSEARDFLLDSCGMLGITNTATPRPRPTTVQFGTCESPSRAATIPSDCTRLHAGSV